MALQLITAGLVALALHHPSLALPSLTLAAVVEQVQRLAVLAVAASAVQDQPPHQVGLAQRTQVQAAAVRIRTLLEQSVALAAQEL